MEVLSFFVCLCSEHLPLWRLRIRRRRCDLGTVHHHLLDLVALCHPSHQVPCGPRGVASELHRVDARRLQDLECVIWRIIVPTMLAYQGHDGKLANPTCLFFLLIVEVVIELTRGRQLAVGDVEPTARSVESVIFNLLFSLLLTYCINHVKLWCPLICANSGHIITVIICCPLITVICTFNCYLCLWW